MAAGSFFSALTRNKYVYEFKVTGTGTAAITEGGQLGSLVDNGTGDYTITFNEPFVATPTILASPIGTAGTTTYTVHTDTASNKVRLVFSADCLFHLVVIGVKDPV